MEEETYQVYHVTPTGSGWLLQDDVPNDVQTHALYTILSGRLPSDWVYVRFHDNRTGFFYQIERIIAKKDETV